MYRGDSYLHHNESIYALIPPEKKVTVKPPMYKSKYPGKSVPTSSTFARATATQIPVSNIAGDYDVAPGNHRFKKEGSIYGKGSHYSDTTSYLKKNTKPTLPEASKFSYKSTSKSPLDCKPAPQQSRQSKNFIKENALQVIMSKPKDTTPNGIDYTKKADYGQRPAYLDDVAKEVEEEQKYIQTIMMQEQQQYTAQQPKMRLLSEEDRLELLDKLKTKWDSIDKKYQLATHMVNLDTIGKVRRKEEYESQLQQLEKSIEKLSKQNVFVQEDMYQYY